MNMAWLFVPLFLPLLLLGWVLTPREEREHRLLESRREQQFARSWGVLYCRETPPIRGAGLRVL
jgi:hypothetical protein